MTSTTPDTSPRSTAPSAARTRHQALAVPTAFFALFSIVGFAFYGLPFFYDFFVKELGWTRAQVTSGNAFAKLVIRPLFGFFAGVFVDRFGPRRLMLVGILLAGLAPVGLGGTTTLVAFYTFYLMNALGYVTGGPLPNQVGPNGRVVEGRWIVYADGASRGNPGPSSIGAAVYKPGGDEAHAVSRRIGRATNNEAEYQAAIAGVEAALGLGATRIELRMDSQLVVRQLEFRYQVRHPRLKPFFARLLELRRQFAEFTVLHVPREQNKRADELANLALDTAPG